MRILVAVLCLAGCAASPPLKSTVTMRVVHHVTLVVDGAGGEKIQACSAACTALACVAGCPTAVVAEGTCPTVAPGNVQCRTFYVRAYEERPGSCSEVPAADNILACSDNHALRERPIDRVALVIFAVIGGAALMVPGVLLLLALFAL